MNNLKSNKAQSVVEFAVILPIMMLVILGIAQLGIIFINAMKLKYTAYMTARVACVYADEDECKEKAGKAALMLKSMSAVAENPSKTAAGDIAGSASDMLREAGASWLQGDGISIEKAEFEKSEADFIKVTVTYNMPLKIPVVNKIFGFYQKNMIHLAASAGGFPFYTLKAVSVMRVQ